MSATIEILLGSVLFSLMVIALALLVLTVRARLLSVREVAVVVNDQTSIPARTGQKLLTVLRDAGIAVPSGCAGIGTCGLCRVVVNSGGGEPLPTETARITRRDIRKGTRLACQVTVRESTTHVGIPQYLLNVSDYECQVVETRLLSPLIREIVLALPQDQKLDFDAGAYIQITAPAYDLDFRDLEFPEPYAEAMAELGISSLIARSTKQVTRAYSIANRPGEEDRIVLLIRLAVPPPGHADASPGIVSSYMFGLKPGDKIEISGPYGEFKASQSEREMVFIGGGVGMAPLRAIILDLLERRKSIRKMSFWYGARSRIDLFYENQFEELAARHSNFNWTAALSDPKPDDAWDGPTGFIHKVVFEDYLKSHPAPDQCEYYLCGPPLMIQAVLGMLEECGIDEDSIFFDDFGSSQHERE